MKKALAVAALSPVVLALLAWCLLVNTIWVVWFQADITQISGAVVVAVLMLAALV